MDIGGLLWAICYIAILVVLARLLIQIAGFPAPLPSIIWAIVTVFCILIIMDTIGGGHYLYYGHHVLK